jgi:hypothetical protein
VTVGIGIVTGEGVVIAADSRTSHTPPGHIARVLSDYTHKVFQVESSALSTYGGAFVNGKNVAGHLAEFAALHNGSNLDAHQCGDELVNFLGPRIDADIATLPAPLPANTIVLGFLVGGYGNANAELWEVTFPQKTCLQLGGPGCCAWRGQTDVIGRLVKGYDPVAIEEMAQKHNLIAERQALQPALEDLEYQIAFDGWNLQDAVDFAVFAVRTTIDTQRLTMGLVGKPNDPSWPGVGGPIEIAVVTARDGFEWVQRTRLVGERAAGVAEDL